MLHSVQNHHKDAGGDSRCDASQYDDDPEAEGKIEGRMAR